MKETWRLGVVGVVFALLLGIIALQLWRIQVTLGVEYSAVAADNQVRLVTTPAPRGDIFDVKGRLVAGTRPALAAVVDLGLVPDHGLEELAGRLGAFLGRPGGEVLALLREGGRQVVVAEDLDPRRALFLAEHRELFPGVAIVPQPVRSYPEGDLAAQVVGYIGRPNAEDLERPDVKGTDFVGKAGVERFYDEELRGTEGVIKYRVDAQGNVLASLGEQDPQPGANLRLTIDLDVQRQLQASLADGLRLARRLEMAERREALAQKSVGERLAEAEEERRAAEAARAQRTATGDEDGGDEDRPEVGEPDPIDPGEVLGPLWDRLPVDDEGVCIPVERHTVELGETVELSGRVPRSFTLVSITGEGSRRRALVRVAGEDFEVGDGDRFATNLRVVDLLADEIVVTATDTWCPVRSVGVVLDPRDGAVVAMASIPTFDPSDFVDGLSREEWERLGSVAAFTNFAIQGQYAPASTFKAVAYMLALEEGIYPLDRPADERELGEGARAVDPEEELEPLRSDTDEYLCTGALRFRFADGSSQLFRDWKRSGHGPLDLHGAFEASCDLYFWEIALRIWTERDDPEGIGNENLFQEWARRFGFGRRTNVDLPFEAAGLVPDREWFRQEQAKGSGRVRPDGPWVGGDLMNIVVGQGDVLVTPLQLANGYAAMVNGGTLWRPRVVLELLDQDGTVLDERPPEVLDRIELRPRTVTSFRADLGRVVNGSIGTARAAFADFGPGVERVGGKTGTAEVIKAPRDRHEFQVDTAWFVGVAPLDDPRYVVAVVVERGGSGGRVAAPIARQVLQFLLNGPEAVTPLAPGEEAD